jgi:hypothetical protein
MQIARRFALSILCTALLGAGILCSAARTRSRVSSAAVKQMDNSPALTIYNQKFAVVRETLPLELKPGANHVEVTDITGHLEPDSVILRPLDSNHHLQILEQNYRNDPISQELLLSLYEGKTIDFQVVEAGGMTRMVEGKIIRSGFVPHSAMAYDFYGQQYRFAQQAYMSSGGNQPVIEVNGRLQFSLPGQPVFPALGDDTVLKPTLSWQLDSDKPGAFPAEFSYVTQGMNWDASYNVVAPPKGNLLQLVGWVTLDNESGKMFKDAHIKLMAGDVNKIQPPGAYPVNGMSAAVMAEDRDMRLPPVTERSFDEYHLYTLENPTTLHDREIKQVEFVRAEGIQSRTVYVYDGFQMDANYRGWSMESLRQQESFGLLSNPKIWVMQEFKNTAANHLGMPLPKGRVRFYRRDEDGQLEFTGENDIDHTPKDEMIRLYTGNAFDLTGERHRIQFQMDTSGPHWVDETFQIEVRNHKSMPVDVRVTEHLYRWKNWEIKINSDSYEKDDTQTIHFDVHIPPNGSKMVKYQVHYSW